MPDIEIINKDGEKFARIKSSTAIDIPKPYTIIFKTTKRDEFENVALTKEQYEKVLQQIERGAQGIILNGEYYDKYSIFRIKKKRSRNLLL